jgi:DASS family divalent anion:Na+ symporter
MEGRGTIAFIGNVFGALTHDASGPSAVIAGSGYVAISDWFPIAFIMTVPVILIWITIGGGWIYLLGRWD